MYNDFHVHTEISSDSEAPIRSQIERAIDLGMDTLCITDHQDFDFPAQVYGLDFIFDTADYFRQLTRLKEEHADRIELRIGVELGLQLHLKEKLRTYAAEWPFDYIIGSIHLVRSMDPYYSDFYEGRPEDDAYREYFQVTLDNVKLHDDYDALGHLDYVVRYGPNRNKFYTYEKFSDEIDEILRTIIDKGIALECNTAGYKYQLGHTNPHPDVISRYVELGGEMVTLGSDAHQPQHLGYAFSDIREMLRGCGLRYLTQFRQRRPEMIPL